jgi:hypothetical protein
MSKENSELNCHFPLTTIKAITKALHLGKGFDNYLHQALQ